VGWRHCSAISDRGLRFATKSTRRGDPRRHWDRYLGPRARRASHTRVVTISQRVASRQPFSVGLLRLTAEHADGRPVAGWFRCRRHPGRRLMLCRPSVAASIRSSTATSKWIAYGGLIERVDQAAKLKTGFPPPTHDPLLDQKQVAEANLRNHASPWQTFQPHA